MIKPIGKKLLLKDIQAEKRESGIILNKPDEKILRGEVIELSNSDVFDALGINIGDKVIYNKFKGTPVWFDGIAHTVLHVDELMAVL